MEHSQVDRPQGTAIVATIVFGLSTFFFVLVTHAIAYMAHEYSHSFMAWSLGWMADPLALDYGHSNLSNLLFLGEVDDNVHYEPIFASGHGVQASIIALAGVVIGNGVLYSLCYRLANTRVVASSRFAVSFLYWLSLMCAGNVWSYVPIRAITTHADIALAARGLGIPTWALFPFLIVPALYIVRHFFGAMFARCHARVSGGSPDRLMLMIAVTAFWFFCFFGGDGASSSYGLISQLMSLVSRYLLFPFSAVFLASRYLFAPRHINSGALSHC
jgi:hypothetical protein